jgi:membrane protease YdiL (CAAX protease family)
MAETRAPTVADVGLYFGLVLALTVPLWLAGGATGIMLMPGLPLAGLSVVCPLAAALIVVLWRGGPKAAGGLLARIGDAGRVRPLAWWLAFLLIPPAVGAAAFLILRLTGSAVPDPQFPASLVLSLLATFLVAGFGEELGWTGFALEPLRGRYGVAGAGLIIGLAWAVWHYPALLQADRGLAWIGWWTLGTVSQRLIMVWLYEAAGRSLAGAVVFHATNNLAWQLFPVRGSWFDPRVHGLLMAGIALALFLLRPAPGPRGRRTTPSPAG